MTSSPAYTGIGRTLVAAGVCVCLLAACTVTGPAAVRSGRLEYNRAIIDTDNQQLLMAVIRYRYVERGSLLAVASVTANVSVRTDARIQLGFGDGDNYVGNLVPLAAGAVYEENPTISYVPVDGEQYAQQFFAPVSVAALAQLSGELSDPTYIYTTLVSSVNGIRNPDFLHSPDQLDPRFDRFVSLMTRLTQAQRLHWLANQDQPDSFSVVIENYAPTYSAEVGELLELLGLPAPADTAAPVVLPVFLALEGRPSGGIGITTRSVFRLAQILTAAVEVPDEDKRNGVAAGYPALGLSGRDLRVRYSAGKPRQAAVAVNYRGGWFYIDDTDIATKRFFRMLGTLWSVAIAETTSGKASSAPVLTVPVSR